MIKGFKEFINESEDRDKAADLRRLNRLGLVNDAEYVTSIIKLAKDEGRQTGDLLEPGKMIFEIEEGGEEDLLSLGMRDAMTNFKGPKGEVPVWIKGHTNEPYYDFEITMSDDSTFRMSYLHFYGPQTLSLERGGQHYELDEESREQVEEAFANHGEWSLYLNDALWMLLDLANNK